MARAYSDRLNAVEYFEIVREISETRGIKPRSAERAIQRYLDTGKAPYGSQPLASLIDAPSRIAGNTYYPPGKKSGKGYDRDENVRAAYGSTAWDVEAEVQEELDADAERFAEDEKRARAAIKSKRESYVPITRIVSITINRITAGQRGIEYNDTSGDFEPGHALRRGGEEYSLTIETEDIYIQ